MPDNYNGTDRVKFADTEYKMSNFLSAGDFEHAGHVGVDHAAAGRCARGQVRRDRIAVEMVDKHEITRCLRGGCSR